MTLLRRILGVTLLGALAATAALGLASCAKNDILGEGLDQYILVQDASPLARTIDTNPDSAYKWEVNSIDSIIFNNDIDSTTLQVTTLQVFDSLGHLVPGTVRFMPGNAYIHYTVDWADNAAPNQNFAFAVRHLPLGSTMSKVYFIPARPYQPHHTYTYVLATGVRMLSGKFVRDHYSYSFTTGDSVRNPNPYYPEGPTDVH